MKYMVSWVVHFCGKRATVRRIQKKRNQFEDLSHEIFIFDSEDPRSGHPYFDCCRETSGSRHATICETLASPHGLTTTRGRLRDLIVALSQKRVLSFIFDPAVDSSRKSLDRSVQIASTDTSVEQALLSVLAQAGLAFRAQGGVIYVFNKPGKMPNKTIGQRP